MKALSCTALALSLLCAPACRGETTREQIESGGLTRTYYLQIPAGLPADKAVPLLLLFHGSGDNGLGIAELTSFNRLADHEKFILVCPDAVAKNWNDGREAAVIASQKNHVDDVAFTAAVIEAVSRKQRIDERRIYVAGFSNGGIFAHLLGARLANKLAAIAIVGGGIAEPVAPKFQPASPLSVFMIHGTKDPFVPHDGGDVDATEGRIISTDKTVALWKKSLGLDAPPRIGELADKDAGDGCRVQWSQWTGGKSGTELMVHTVTGGGHAWPGGPQFQPISVIGRVCRDYSATETIWEFFKRQSR